MEEWCTVYDSGVKLIAHLRWTAYNSSHVVFLNSVTQYNEYNTMSDDGYTLHALLNIQQQHVLTDEQQTHAICSSH